MGLLQNFCILQQTLLLLVFRFVRNVPADYSSFSEKVK